MDLSQYSGFKWISKWVYDNVQGTEVAVDNNEGKTFSKTHLNFRYWGQISVFWCVYKMLQAGMDVANQVTTEEAVVSLYMLMYY